MRGGHACGTQCVAPLTAARLLAPRQRVHTGGRCPCHPLVHPTRRAPPPPHTHTHQVASSSTLRWTTWASCWSWPRRRWTATCRASTYRRCCRERCAAGVVGRARGRARLPARHTGGVHRLGWLPAATQQPRGQGSGAHACTAVARPAPPCSRFLAVGSYDSTVRILSLADGTQLRAVATQGLTVGLRPCLPAAAAACGALPRPRLCLRCARGRTLEHAAHALICSPPPLRAPPCVVPTPPPHAACRPCLRAC
jgi:hypothetical protein